MRRGAFIVVVAFVVAMMVFSFGGCKEKKTVDIDTLSVSADSSSAPIDTIESIISEAPMPKAADELFDDFFFNFAANRKLQMNRIKFPLPVDRFGKLSSTTKAKWSMEHFFMHQDFYTLIFDNAKQMNLVKDTTIDKVTVEKIYLDRNMVKQYRFGKELGQWMLMGVDYKALGENKNASFLKFYKEFVTDSAFQIRSISDPLQFSGPDPTDEFSTMSGILAPEQWPSFAPELPDSLIYNIIYGQKYTESSKKIFVIRGIANGLETELTFKRTGGEWKLIKLLM